MISKAFSIINCYNSGFFRGRNKRLAQSRRGHSAGGRAQSAHEESSVSYFRDYVLRSVFIILPIYTLLKDVL